MKVKNYICYASAVACVLLVVVTPSAFAAGQGETAEEITLYSGRGESLVAPLIERFEEETGIAVDVRYGDTAELAVLMQEEGDASPADVYWAQDGGALGGVARAGLFTRLPEDIAGELPAIFTNETGEWVATSGRARVLAYHPDRVSSGEMPSSVFDLTDDAYEGRVGWAPTNGSLQSFVTAMRVMHGDDATLEWLEGLRASGAKTYRNNTAIVEAIAAGEIDMGIVNHYYLLRFLDEDPDYPVEQRFFEAGDVGNLVNVAGVGILEAATNPDGAERFVRFLLSPEAQQYFTDEVFEYPVIRDVEQNPNLESSDTLLEVSPRLDLDELEDLDGTLELLREAGAL
ncbi:MAG: iron ABC transporter substrate-binding protein [Spirochaetaceae bacterium]